MRAWLRPVGRAAREARAHARGVAAWAAGRASSAEVRLAFGVRVPESNEPAHGGLIKLQHLKRAYAEDARQFNVLYLVSSRLPDGAVTLARWAQRKGARVVLNQNGVAYPAWYGEGWQHENAAMAELLALADHVFYQSAFCRTSADRFAGAARGAAEVLVNPVDAARFMPAPKPPSGRKLTLLLAGSQDQWYRFESAVRTLSVVRQRGADAELFVTGRLGWRHDAREARREADSLIAELQVNGSVTLLGPYTQEHAPVIFQRADLLLHTKYNDPCPTVVLEALACGLPIVYSRSGGVPELVGDAGIGVDAELSWDRDIPPDPERLADAVMAVQRDSSRFSVAARERATHFDVSRWLARHDEVFRALVRAA